MVRHSTACEAPWTYVHGIFPFRVPERNLITLNPMWFGAEPNAFGVLPFIHALTYVAFWFIGKEEVRFGIVRAMNMLITLINQANYHIDGLIDSLNEKHRKEGGFTENLYKRRKKYRDYQMKRSHLF